MKEMEAFFLSVKRTHICMIAWASIGIGIDTDINVNICIYIYWESWQSERRNKCTVLAVWERQIVDR